MRIRLVNDRGDTFEMTSFSWNRMLRFACDQGWKMDSRLAPMDQFNGEYEVAAGAGLDAEAAGLLAEALERRAASNLLPDFLMEELESMGDSIDDPAEHACNFIAEWREFAAFAHKGGFLVERQA